MLLKLKKHFEIARLKILQEQEGFILARFAYSHCLIRQAFMIGRALPSSLFLIASRAYTSVFQAWTE